MRVNIFESIDVSRIEGQTVSFLDLSMITRMPIVIFYAGFIRGLNIAEVIPSDFGHFDVQRPKSAGPRTRAHRLRVDMFAFEEVYRLVIRVK